MTDDEQRLTEMNEGRSRKIYIDTVGKTTGGCGRNLSDKGFRDDEVDLMLANDYREARTALLAAFPWVSAFDDVRLAAMTDLSFNLGITKLKRFPRFLSSAKAHDWELAGKNLRNSLWFRQVGLRGPRIIRMFTTGLWPWA